MSSVEDRWWITEDGQRTQSPRHGKGLRYDVRYRDPAGRQRHKAFAKKGDADRFAATVEADKLRGTFIDPHAGRITLAAYAEAWLASQTFDESTREATASRLRRHILPTLGLTTLIALKPSQLQAWLRSLQQTLAPSYVRVIAATLSAILGAAVDDERISRNPMGASSIKLPRLDPARVTPWSAEQVARVRAALPQRFQIMAVIGAGLGLRQGEVFGLGVEDVDFLRGVVRVRRQVKIVGARQVFALPKGRKVRDIPLPESVALQLSAHLQALPAVEVMLPWESSTGQPRAAALILSTRERTALNRNYINAKVWKPSLVAAGLEPTRANGMHALRHFYASVLLDAGESVRALSDYLGHADPGFTLRTYTHLMPASEERTKRAVDRAFDSVEEAANGPRCAPSVRQEG